MKIKVISAQKPDLWYAENVGEVFEVEGYRVWGDFFVKDDSRSFIGRDCEILN